MVYKLVVGAPTTLEKNELSITRHVYTIVYIIIYIRSHKNPVLTIVVSTEKDHTTKINLSFH